jgi:putative oxidoreductase
MTTAIRKVHLRNGVWNTQGGYEFNLALIASALALVECGPGAPSVDRALSIELKGSGWALASLAMGAAGAALAIEAGKQAEEEPAEERMQRTGRFSRHGQVTERETIRTAA